MAGKSAASKYRSALFTVSKPKPECSRSKSVKSQPADFMMWPMPGVANSTMKCPNFGVLVRAIALRPASAIGFLPIRRERSLADEIAFGDGLLPDEPGGLCFENRKMRRLQMRLEGETVIVDFIKQDAIGV